MRMFNVSAEGFKIQCNSRVLVFKPRGSTDVPDDLYKFVESQLKDYGVFSIYPSMNEEEIKIAHRQAMLNYLHGILRMRIVNFTAQADEFKKKGVTLEKDPSFSRALRWDKEIRYLLDIEDPIEVELSFLDDEQRKKLGMEIPGSITHVESDLFNAEKIKLEAQVIRPEEVNAGPSDDDIASMLIKPARKKPGPKPKVSVEVPAEG